MDQEEAQTADQSGGESPKKRKQEEAGVDDSQAENELVPFAGVGGLEDDRVQRQAPQLPGGVIANPDTPPSWALELLSKMSAVADTNQLLCSRVDRLENLQQNASKVTEDIASLRQQQQHQQQILDSILAGKAPYNRVPPPQGQAQPSGAHPQAATGPATDPWHHYKAHQASASTAPPRLPQPVARGPTPANSMTSPTASPGSGTDFNHMVVGGWARDTPRNVILRDVDSVKSALPRDVQVDRVAVWGVRATIAHLHLEQLPYEEARERSQQIRTALDALSLTTSANHQPIWVSPSRTPEKRQRNRVLRAARERVQSCSNQILDDENLEIDWGVGVVFLQGRRVASTNKRHIFPEPNEAVIQSAVFDPSSDESFDFYFNLTQIARSLDVGEKEAEAKLRTE